MFQFIWNENKRRANIKKHGIDFEHVFDIFYDDYILIEDDRFDYGEQRFWAIGFYKAKLIVVVHVYIRNDLVRIISAREATKQEYEQYFE